MGKSYSKEEVVIAQNANGEANATTSQRIGSTSVFELLLIALVVIVSAGAVYYILKKCRKHAVHTLRQELNAAVLNSAVSRQDVSFLVTRDVLRITNDDDKKVILNDFHLLPSSGHAGANRMLNNIKNYYFWPGMSVDVNNYVKRCKSCQLHKHSNKKIREPMVITSTADTAFSRISLDLMGPLDLDNYNYKYILTVQCDLSKFIEAYPLMSKDTITVSRSFVNNFVLRYGIPHEIITDKGKEFMSSVLTETCKLLGINKLNSTPFHHETLGSLENSHKHLGAYLRIQCENNKTDWSDWIPFWCFSYNTSVHTETKYTPHELVFGKLCKLPSNLYNKPLEPLYTFDDYTCELKYRLQKAHFEAKQNLLQCKQQRKLTYDQHENPVQYKKGDLILLKNQSRTKLDNVYDGPFEVIEDMSPNVKIKKGNNKEYVIHKNNTKLFTK